MPVRKGRSPVAADSAESAFTRVRERFRKSFSDLSLVGGKDSHPALAWLNTGNTEINAVLGDPELGIPSGRLVEVYSAEGHGKTTLCLKLLALAQAQGGMAVLADSENGYNESWAKLQGVDTDELLVVQLEEYEDKGGDWTLEGLEELLTKFEEIINIIKVEVPDKPTVIVWDSVTGTPPRAELDGTYQSSPMAAQARALSRGLRRIVNVIRHSPVILVCINQTRSVIGPRYSMQETPGGRALKFYSSVRAKVKRKERSKDEISCEIENVKNRLSPPFRSGKLKIDFKRGLLWVKSRSKKAS